MSDTEQSRPELPEEHAADLAALQEMAGETGPDSGQGPDGSDTGPEIDTAEFIEGIAAPMFAIMAPDLLKPAEVKALAGAWAPVIDKYFPDLNLGVELNAAIVTLAIVGPKVAAAKAEKKAEAERQEAGDQVAA